MKYDSYHSKSKIVVSLHNAFTKHHRGHSLSSVFLIFLSFMITSFGLQSNLQAQCNYNMSTGSGPVTTFTNGMPAPPAMANFTTIPTLLAGNIEVTSEMSITICFYGDMNDADETFNVTISGQAVPQQGGFGTSPTAGSPQCEDFLISAANVQADIQADGDVDILYNNFGAGWDFMGGELFGARVESANFSYRLDLGLTASSTQQCQDGTDIVFTTEINPDVFFPSTSEITISREDDADFTVTDDMNIPFLDYPIGGVLDISDSEPGTYNVIYRFSALGCEFTDIATVEIFPVPSPTLRDYVYTCLSPGDSISLDILNDGADDGGTYSINGGLAISATNSVAIPANGGCFDVTYTAPNPNSCPNAPYQETVSILMTMDVFPDFALTGTTSPACMDGGNVVIGIQQESFGPNQDLTLEDDLGNPIQNIAFGNVSLPAPTSAGSINYEICLTETNMASATTCGPLTPEDCTKTVCQNFTVYNDGVSCGVGSPFASTCEPGSDGFTPCPVNTSPNLKLKCKFFEIPTIQVVEASLSGPGVIFCEDEDVCLTYSGNLAGLGATGTGGRKMKDFPGVGAVCTVLGFSVDIDLGFTDITIAPFGNLGDFCDKTITQFIAEAIAAFFDDSDGGGGIVHADTDGDGAFDTVIDTYAFPESKTIKVPNNVTSGTSAIMVRNIVRWPDSAKESCGDADASGADLLKILPIGGIPLVGNTIESALKLAGCSIPVSFSDEETKVIPVINNSPPVFANCNADGYVFGEDYACLIENNWSLPVAFDGCTGDNLSYIGRTAGTDDSMFDTQFGGTPPPVVVPSMPGIYQTAGPVIGSNLPPGSYSVTYTAYNCSGIDAECTFPLEVTTGAPVLVAPNDFTVNNDVDECEAVVTGLAPIRGVGCSTVINYDITFPANSGMANMTTNTPYTPVNLGTLNDPSGISFPFGTSTIEYTLTVDINGDGDFTDPGEVQTETFTITVIDEQKPTEICVDITIRLDNTGNRVVFAENQMDGTPYIDGLSFDNCDVDPEILIAKPGDPFTASVNFACGEVGNNILTLRVTDESGNVSQCLAQVEVEDFYTEVQISMDTPELCLEANNPVQLDFSNYTDITLPNGTVINPNDVSANSFLGDTEGAFGITAFLPHTGTTDMDPGSITPQGVYTPGTGTGYVVVSYMMALPGVTIPQNGNLFFAECFIIKHTTFELRQPLDMIDPTCECGDAETRDVDLGVLTGGLEPYTIQYSGVRLDVDGDGFADDDDGQYVYDTPFGHDVNDFQEDLGVLKVEYTQPVWSLTVVDARGCEIFRSGSCDNDDLTEGPQITCPTPPAAPLEADADACDVAWEWEHTLPMDNCKVIIYTYEIENPDGTIEGPFNLEALLNILPPGPSQDLFTANYEFELGTSTIRYYAEDAVGNYIECDFEVEVLDAIAPVFTNCPYPPVITNVEANTSTAYVNFSLPIATDNCANPTITQIDQTGYTVGDQFPIGSTILFYEATDAAGNSDTCQVNVIVNDVILGPTLECIADVTQPTDPAQCNAVVNNLTPTYTDPTNTDNVAIVYEIFSDSMQTDRVACGVTDASGETFEMGTSYVKYTVQNASLLLISEITQSGATDQIEIVNLGPASMDITGLEIGRQTNAPATTEDLPTVNNLPLTTPTILGVGQVLVYNFTSDAAATTPACYTISFGGVIFDEVSVNGQPGCNGFTGALAAGDVYRNCEADSNDAEDWFIAEPCFPSTIGTLNPELDAMADNGTTSSLQSIPPLTQSCTAKVTINDEEDPEPGELVTTVDTNVGSPMPAITDVTCNRSNLNITTDCNVGLLEFNMTGTANPSNSTIRLISPAGTEVEITALPYNMHDFFQENSNGTWILEVEPNTAGPFTVTAWNVDITCLQDYSQIDVTLNNEPGLNGANFTWNHPFFTDNCFDGTLEVAYNTNDAPCLPTGGMLTADPNGVLPGIGGFENTEFFCIGTTTVTYTLIDDAGNPMPNANGLIVPFIFNVIILDVEAPAVTCPDDIIVNLNGGECRRPVCFEPVFASDNNIIADTLYSIEPCSDFEIGVTTVTITIVDASGNSTPCDFDITVNEFVPTSGELACNDVINISLNETCNSEITGDMVLEGSNYGCYEDYNIVLTDGIFPVPNSPFVDLDDVGNTYTVTITDPDTGNSCWTMITIEDKLNPEIECPADLTIFCNEDKFPVNTGFPALLSCESSITTQFNDVFSDNPPCDDIRGILERTFTITDESGNSSECSQIITMKRLAVSDVTFPQSYDGFAQPIFSCVDLANNPTLTNVTNTGLPTVNGISIMNQPYCGISVTMEEDLYPTCTGSYDILRTFNVYDPCLPVTPGVNPFSYIQVIKVVDNTPPVITCPQDYTVSTNAITECLSTQTILAAAVTDDCSPTEVHTDLPSGTVLTNGGLAFDMEIGTHLVTYYAYDDCGNLATCSFNLTVADLTPPTPVCDEITTVDLTNEGLAEVFVETFDDGSYDDCCLDRLEVRRMSNNCNVATNTTFDESITFCCEDVASSPILVEMQAVDCEGNTNTCMVQVLVEDKLAPTIGCPANAEITCDEYSDIFSAALIACENADATAEDNCQSAEITAAGYGTPIGFDNCTFSIDTTVTVTINQCGTGSIVRTYTITDASGNGGNAPETCTQVITVAPVSDFVVEFPEDLEGFCDQATPDFGEPEIFFETCELVATSFSDQVFDNVPGACFKVVRQWTVINWCVVGDNINQEANAIELSESELNEDLDGDGDQDDHTFRDSYRGLATTSDNDPDPDNWDGYITYQQTVKVIDNEAPVIDPTFEVANLCILDGNDGTDDDYSDCTFSGVLPTPDYTDCTTLVETFDADGNLIINELTITAEVFDMDNNLVSNSVNVTDLEIGTYTVRYLANDMCGNSTATDFTFNVSDCKFPTPYCKDGLVLTLMEINDPNNTSFENMIEIWATDFDEGSYDNCSENVQLSFSSDVNDINAVFNCDNIGENVVEMWVTDAAGNQDFCETFVIIQAPLGGCDIEDPLVGGVIANAQNEGVQDVTVDLNSDNGFATTFTTVADGYFNMNVPMGGDYTVTPVKDINPTNGITTFDLVKISKHILNVEFLDSPYKMIAADINNSQTITTLDLVKLRKLILIIDTEFSNNTSWRFVDKNYVFPDPTNPWAETFPEVLNLNNLTANQTALDFVGIKIGDVNGSANANELLGADDRTFNGKLNINVADQHVTAGEMVTVEFNAADFNHLGYQFTLGFDNLTFVDLQEGLATTENFGLHLLEEGILTTSWNDANAQQLNDATLFTLTFKATATGRLSDFLTIRPTHTAAEAYAENGDLQNVNLDFDNAGINDKFELYQNFPNPFADKTSIQFYLPTAESGTLTVSDIDGKVIQVIAGNFTEGLNQISLNKENLGSYGVLYYQLSTQNYSATRRMVFIGQ